MSGSTNHYGLERLGAGDDLSDNGFKYTDADRQAMDRLLYIGAESHHHDGAVPVVNDPTDAPVAVLDPTGGTIPAGTRVYYRYTWVDVNGFESAASAEGFVDTDLPVAEPAAPQLSFLTTGGTLLPGVYYYIVTAYTDVNTNESKAIAPAYLTIPIGSATNKVTINFPSLPSGADGLNIYVKKPGEVRYNYLTSVDMTMPTPPTSFVDTGAIAENCNRTIPIRNTTNASNSITITVPTVPVGSTWRLYRTYQTGLYQSSLLHWVVEETFETSGIITNVYEDVGNATTEGQPPSASQSIGSPAKIRLTDAAEVQGTLPMGRVGHPFEITFLVSGALTVTVGTAVWMCEYPTAKIVGCRAVLGRGFAPSAQAVLVDVNKSSATATPVFTTIYSTQANRPSVPVGAQFGTRTIPNSRYLVEGDMLTVDIDQIGGGATPTDRDLTVTVYGVAYGFDADVSFVP